MQQKQTSLESHTSRLMRKLVREITGERDEKTLQSYEQQAFSILRNHRSISINRYEVRRKLDDLKEKFTVDNCKEYADHLERLCNVVLNDPVCLQHYEFDIQWSLLELLFSLSYNPTKCLRHKPLIIIESEEQNKEKTQLQLEELYMKKILKEDFISVQSFDESSDLSDWSESDCEKETETSKNLQTVSKINDGVSHAKLHVVLAPHLPALKPPEKQQCFQLVEAKGDLTHRLRESVYSNLLLNEHASKSNKKESNFAHLLSDYITKRNSPFVHFTHPITAPEFLLLRELLWIFYAPKKCKYFSIIEDKTKLQNNMTVPSISAPTLAEYLEYNILPHIDQMHILRHFLREIYESDRKLPKTLEYYAANLKGLVDPMLEIFVNLEDRIAKQADYEINTLITFQSSLKDVFKKIQILYSIHETSVLYSRKYSTHITSSYLLASLMLFSNAATSIIESNMAISLFLTSIKAFCDIIDCWWNEGRLDDWQDEFLVQYNTDQSISLRLYCKDKESSQFVPKRISKIIGENRFMRLMQEHSLEAGYTLNLLYEISRIGELRSECGAVGENLYDVFIDDLFRQIRSIASIDCMDAMPKNDASVEENVANNDCYENLTTKDEFLMLLFNPVMRHEEMNVVDTCDGVGNANKNPKNALEIFNELEKCQQILPLEELILISFGRILRDRITIANKFVVDLYRGNVDILRHLKNIRKVLLLEASDIMQQFYLKLFKQMEAGQPWANAFVLTMQLDDTISSKYPDMSSLFRLEINSAARVQTQKVFEAVEALTINYSFSNELAKIISEDDMAIYNEVFRFLLKVKWGLFTLENLKFPRIKRRSPYTRLEIGDFLMRRLEQLRFWMFYGIQCVHSHLMMHVLQAMGAQLDEKIQRCKNVREMEAVHKSYLETISEHCFLRENLVKVKFGIEQMLNLVFVLRSEWWSCLKYLEHSSPLSMDVSDSASDVEVEDYAITAQIDTIELTYIRCHQYLANMLNTEVYIYQHAFLSGLSAAFNTSLPC